MDFKICDNNCTNNAIEELQYLKLFLREVLACSVSLGNDVWFCKMEQDFIDELRKATC